MPKLGAALQTMIIPYDALFCQGGLCGTGRFFRDRVQKRGLNRERLSALPKDCVLLELASAPGGFDPEDARKLGLRQRNLPGLPGKYAPEAAAEALEKACRQLFSREKEEKTL